MNCSIFSCFICDLKTEPKADASYMEKNVKTICKTNSFNEDEVDLSHFTSSKRVIGIGGFGMVRTVVKKTGPDKGSTYALKSISKVAVLLRNSGISTVHSELNVLKVLKGCEYICNLHYAFQDDTFLYMVSVCLFVLLSFLISASIFDLVFIMLIYNICFFCLFIFVISHIYLGDRSGQRRRHASQPAQRSQVPLLRGHL